MYQNMLMYRMCVYVMLRKCTKTRSVLDMQMDTESYLRSLSSRSTLQNSALALILDRKIAPVEQHVPEHIFISVGENVHQTPFRRLPRNREQLADFVINFVREMNQKMNTWYNDNINRLHIHYITRNMNLYNNLIHDIMRYRTPSVIRYHMQTVDNIYYMFVVFLVLVLCSFWVFCICSG